LLDAKGETVFPVCAAIALVLLWLVRPMRASLHGQGWPSQRYRDMLLVIIFFYTLGLPPAPEGLHCVGASPWRESPVLGS
jgi:hypothetical protein